jgi:Asp-tRNA(Asn)/Glu-tRNA(Gln) amidotransferase C subunit
MNDKSLAIDKRFDSVDKQLEDMNGQLDKIVKVVVKGFDRIDKTLETKADSADLQRALGLLDSLSKSKRLEISEDERVVMSNQLTKLHDWVERAAKRINLKFEH